MNKLFIVIVFVVGLALGGLAFFSSGSEIQTTEISTEATDNVRVVDGKQIITILARGGYSPARTSAKAETATILRMKTQGSYDCSIALSIPNLDYQTVLPHTGETDIEIPPQPVGAEVQGFCGMVRNNFVISFI